MLSYAEHGKFPAATQGQSPRERDEKVDSGTDPTRMPAMVRNCQWTTGCVAAQWRKVAPSSGDIEHDRLGNGLTGILRLQVIFAA